MGPIPFTSIVTWCKLHDIYDLINVERAYKYFNAMEIAEYNYDDNKTKSKENNKLKKH